MAYGLQIFDASGAQVFDSTVATGGVPAGFWAGGAGTLSFPQFAGRTMAAIMVSGNSEWWVEDGLGVSISYASGYPVVTVQSFAPTFMLAVW
jgi:hypothetical protein